MFESVFGPMSIFYNGYSYRIEEQELYLKRVIYVPQNTEDTKEAFILAAQRGINDYLGNSSEDVNYPIVSDDSSILLDTSLTISLFGFTTSSLYLKNKKAEK